MSFVNANTAHSTGLQAVRGVAAFLVFWQHGIWLAAKFADGPAASINNLALGATGVLLFFTLSGFLMAGQIGRPAKKFLFDRLRRIYPGFLIATFLSAAALSYFGLPFWPRLTTLLLVPAGVADPIHIPYWTLVYEMHFYLLVLSVGRLPVKVQMPLFLAWAVFIVYRFYTSPLDMAQSGYPNIFQISQSFYNLYFICGIFAWHSIRIVAPTRIDGILAALLSSAIVGVNIFIESAGLFYHFAMLVATFLIIRYMSSASPSSLFSRAMVRLGDVSYGVYLIHITTSLLTVLILKDVLGLEMGYWSGALCILLIGGSTSYLFGWGELKLQDKIKQMKLFASLRSPVRASSIT